MTVPANPPRRTRALALVGALALTAVAAGPPPPTEGGQSGPAGTIASDPAGLPPAATTREPQLPAPMGWPFPESFPRTSGTGRYDAGAFFWTDFIYDDTGARGLSDQASNPRGAESPPGHAGELTFAPNGTYHYARTEALGNGADIFRTAVGTDPANTYWRVDWNTLTRHSDPIAAFLIDTDHSSDTGLEALPANIGATAPGTDAVIVLTSQQAWLHDASGRRPVGRPDTYTVDYAARSFVLRLPRTDLKLDGASRIRLVAGAADGDQFRTVTSDEGALPGQPNIYNVTFRTREQELAADGQHSWMDARQATELARGDITAFRVDIDWSDLDNRRMTPEPEPRGWSNRWYVSTFEFGQGVRKVPSGETFQIDVPFPGRVQPYGVYIPAGYQPDKPTPLTWMVHSGNGSHNQYHSYSPRFVHESCEERGAICVTPLGRGPWGWGVNEAELDFWETWAHVTGDFHVDFDRVSITGASMGGYVTFRLALLYPDVFAAAAVIAGPLKCGEIEIVPGALGLTAINDDDRGTCLQDGDLNAVLVNGRHQPFHITQGGLDVLVPAHVVEAQVQRLDELGYRYRYELYPVEDHIAYIAIKDGFSSSTAHLDRDREPQPATIHYAFHSGAQRPDLGVGPVGAWWVTDLQARSVRPGLVARVTAESKAIPEPQPDIQRTQHLRPDASPSPAIVRELRWEAGETLPRQPHIDIHLRNVGRAAVDLAGAGLHSRETGTIWISTDGPVTVHLTGLRPGSRVRTATGQEWTANGFGEAEITLPGGAHWLELSR